MTPSFDPSPYAETIARITAAAKAAGYVLPEGASEAELVEAEQALGVTFPPELRAFYLVHNGGLADFSCCNGRELLSLKVIVSRWSDFKKQFDSGMFENNRVAAGVGVQEAWWVPRWIPITFDSWGNHDHLDMAPGIGGKPGQILSSYSGTGGSGFWYWEDVAARNVEAPDFLTWLEGVRFFESDDEHEVGRRALLTT